MWKFLGINPVLFYLFEKDFLGWPNFYWRIVRPNKVNDVGPLHRDEWFWKLNPEFLEHAKDEGFFNEKTFNMFNLYDSIEEILSIID